MKRRALLAGLGTGVFAGVSGCVSTGSEYDSPTPTPEPPECNSPQSRRLEVTETKDLPAAAALSIEARVERALPTAEEPALLHVQLTNEGREREIAWPNDPRCHPFNRDRGFSDPRGVQLYHRTGTPEKRVEPCWTRDAIPHERNPGWNGYGCPESMLAAGETVTFPLEVWDDFRINGYMPTGTYRFETDPLTVPEASTIDWWFELEVLAP